MFREVWDRHGNLISSEPEPAPPVALLPVDLVALFTPTELLALEQSTDLRVVSFRVQFFSALNAIALDDPRLLQALSVMQQVGIVTAERAQQILGTHMPD